MMKKHQGPEHDISNITTVQGEQKEHLTTIFYQMDAEIQECVESVQKLNTLQESMESSLEEQRQNFRKHLGSNCYKSQRRRAAA